MVVSLAGAALADVNPVTPSTNDINRDLGWAHVDASNAAVGSVDLTFVSERAFWSCFEYRTDGDTSQIIAENGGVNYNTDITDGLYPYTCQNNSSLTMTISASEYVEVRMVFGAETDERFDWTRFDVLAATTKADCKSGGWETLGFKNQGQCIASIVANDNAEPHN
jgi:hypothetical protein